MANLQVREKIKIDWVRADLAKNQMAFKVGAYATVLVKACDKEIKQVLLTIDGDLKEMLRVDDEDMNEAQFQQVLDQARDKLGTGSSEWREVKSTLADLLRRCRLVVERFVDHTYRLLSRTTVL